MGNVIGAVDGKLPFAAKISFRPILCCGRDDRNKQRTFANVLFDLRIPRVSSAQLILVEPHLHALATQRLGNPSRCISVLTSVTEEDGGDIAGLCAGVVHGVMGASNYGGR